MKKETELLLKEVVAKALGAGAPAVVDNTMENMAKALSAIATKVDDLSGKAVMKEEETPDSKMDAISKSVAQLTDIVAKLASGEKIVPEAKLPETASELNDIITKAIAAALKKDVAVDDDDDDDDDLGGEGSDDELEKTLADKKSKKKVNKSVDLTGVELTDLAGNDLTEAKRTARKGLDDYFLQKITN